MCVMFFNKAVVIPNPLMEKKVMVFISVTIHLIHGSAIFDF